LKYKRSARREYMQRKYIIILGPLNPAKRITISQCTAWTFRTLISQSLARRFGWLVTSYAYIYTYEFIKGVPDLYIYVSSVWSICYGPRPEFIVYADRRTPRSDAALSIVSLNLSLGAMTERPRIFRLYYYTDDRPHGYCT